LDKNGKQSLFEALPFFTNVKKKETVMKATECVPQKISKFMLGSFLLAAASGLIIIGISRRKTIP